MFAITLGLTFGLISSLHCVGMCGPLVLAIHKNSSITSFNVKSILNPILYNIGRILSYILIGLIIGFFGEVIKFAIVQEQISIFTGVMLLFIGITTKFNSTNTFKSQKLNNVINYLKNKIAYLLKNQSNSKMFFLGVLNGFLPCGMVYMALASSLAMPDITHTMLFMASFGLGTSPLLISLFVTSNLIPTSLRVKLNKFVPLITILLGFIIVLRGMNLGIPYISPDLDKAKDRHTEKMETKKALDSAAGGYCY